MGKLVGVGVAMLVLFACSTVHVPSTPEGQACVRECMLVRNTCVVGCPQVNGGFCELGCANQRKDCLRTCPGATED